MKYLFLLLLPLTAFAEFRVEVKNLHGTLTNEGFFESTVEAEKWIADQSFAFGKPERTIPKSEATEEELASQVLEEIEAQGEVPAQVKLKKTYSVLISDISAEKALEAAKSQALKELANCQNAHATFKARKAIQGLSDAQKIQLATSLEVKKVVDALTSCSIPFAKLMIGNYPVDDLVTAEDKAEMIKDLEK